MKRTVTIYRWNAETETYEVEHIEYDAHLGRTDPVRTDPKESK